MYKTDLADFGRGARAQEIERRREEIHLGDVKHHWEMQKEMLGKAWAQAKDTSLAMIYTLLSEISKRQKSVLGVLDPATIKFTVDVANSVFNWKKGRQEKREAERYEDEAKKAQKLMAYWEESAAIGMATLSRAGVPEMTAPPPETAEELLKLLKGEQYKKPRPFGWDPFANMYTKDEDKADILKALKLPATATEAQVMAGIKKKYSWITAGYKQKQYFQGTWAPGYLASSANAIRDLSVVLSELLEGGAPLVVPSATVTVSEAVASASPKDGVLQRVLERNVQMAQDIVGEGKDLVPVKPELGPVSATPQEIPVTQMKPEPKGTAFGWFWNAVDRISLSKVL